MAAKIVAARSVSVRPAKKAPATPTAPAVAPQKAAASRPTFSAGRAGAPGGAPVVIRAQNLHKYYVNVHARDGVDLELRKGEVMGFLGPNGAGKTTFTKCLLGFIKPSAGRVELFGLNVHEHGPEVLGRVGLVPDQYDFYPLLNGRQVLDYYARLYGVPASERTARVEEVLQLVGMQEHARRKVREYSHGMKQRLCIAQALVNRPELIIFDEPTNGLDPRGAFETRELMKQLSSQGVTIFLNSHVLTEVEAVCTRVAILSKGRILVTSSVGDLRRKLKGNVERVTVTLENPAPKAESLPIERGIANRATLEADRLQIELAPGAGIPEVVNCLVQGGFRILNVQEDTVGLEQIFLELTKGEGGI
ncbi:MAG: ABC transporter ATP-binding protein [Euryarchaeota archaeon]|nr:ABC transporter ATP-binding protein [Euryarchaeota archaeon]